TPSQGGNGQRALDPALVRPPRRPGHFPARQPGPGATDWRAGVAAPLAAPPRPGGGRRLPLSARRGGPRAPPPPPPPPPPRHTATHPPRCPAPRVLPMCVLPQDSVPLTGIVARV